MESIPVSAERKAELEAWAREHDRQIADIADEALASFLDRQEQAETIAAVLEGRADFEAGRSRPAEEVFAELRKKHGISR